MNYSQKTIDKSKEFQNLELSDAFNEVKISIDVLSMLELSALGDNFGSSVQKIIHNAIDELDAIQYLIETNYVEKRIEMDSISSIVDIVNNRFYQTEEESKGAQGSTPSRAHSVRPLTTYKDVVYNIEEYKKLYDEKQKENYKLALWKNFDESQIIHYGLTKENVQLAERKIAIQKDFLNYSNLYDKITGNTIPLSHIIISANHSPDRYYGEVQNRVNTLIEEANQKELVPLFMTITLPSEYHPFKMKNKNLVKNTKYNGATPNEAVKALTKRFANLRNDRAFREIPTDERVYFRVNEPHKSGTPHTHILYYVPKSSVERVIEAFKRLFSDRANKIELDLQNAGSYVMKYINKTLPNSIKQQSKKQRNRYMNAWYVQNRIIRFSSSRTLAPLHLYRLLYKRYSLKALTKLNKEDRLTIYVEVDNPNRILEIFDGDEIVYMKNENFTLEKYRSV